MKNVCVEILGTVTPTIPDCPLSEKVKFLDHELMPCESKHKDCNGCFFNEPWFNCDNISCLSSDRSDGIDVVFREAPPHSR